MRQTSSRFVAILASLAFTVGAAEGRSFAQEHSAGDLAQARELLNQGLALRQAGNLAGAIEDLRAAHTLANTPITAIELARTYLAAGKLVEARETLLSIGRLPVTSQETARSTRARSDAAQLADEVRAHIPSLIMKVNGVPLDSVAVTLDGAVVPMAALTAPRLVNPGSHELVATSTSGGAATATVEVKEGETRTVELKIVPVGVPPTTHQAPAHEPEATTNPPADAASRSGESWSHTLDWALVGGGGALGLGGGASMLVAASRASSARRSDAVGNSAASVTEYNSAKTPYYVGLAGAVAGGAALGVGVLLLATSGAGPAAVPPAGGTGFRASPWMASGRAGVQVEGTW
jgi:hypothetical protein